MRGPVVGQLQDVLIRLGLIRDCVANRDEFYGAATRAVVIRFQESNGLRGDGRVGPKTWAALLGQL
jgi:peptidoglycan hydrolase-like protein with peptidoglycan-binding domain